MVFDTSCYHLLVSRVFKIYHCLLSNWNWGPCTGGGNEIGYQLQLKVIWRLKELNLGREQWREVTGEFFLSLVTSVARLPIDPDCLLGMDLWRLHQHAKPNLHRFCLGSDGLFLLLVPLSTLGTVIFLFIFLDGAYLPFGLLIESLLTTYELRSKGKVASNCFEGMAERALSWIFQ